MKEADCPPFLKERLCVGYLSDAVPSDAPVPWYEIKAEPITAKECRSTVVYNLTSPIPSSIPSQTFAHPVSSPRSSVAVPVTRCLSQNK